MYNQAIQGSKTLGMGAAQYQGQSYPDAPIEPPGLISFTATTISDRATRLYDISYRIQKLADRIYGSQPEAVSGSNQSLPDPKSDVERLQQSLESLNSAIDRLDVQLARVEHL